MWRASTPSATGGNPQIGVAAQKVSFRSASELAQLFRLVGKQFDALQLSAGPLNGRFAMVNLGSVALLKISTTQRLLLNGDRGPDCISFSLEASGQADNHKVHSVPVAAYSIHGFRQGLLESHFELSANSTTYLTITSCQRFNTYLERSGLDGLIEQMQTSNARQIAPRMHQHLAQEFERLFQAPLTTALQRQEAGHRLYTLFRTCLLHNSAETWFIPFAPSPRQKLVQDLISWGFVHGREAFNLDEVCRTLYASRRTLTQGTKEALGLGPMEVLKHIRLQQVNGMLHSEELRHAAGLHTVTEVAQHFGFHSRGHFAKAYQQLFAESPSSTLSQVFN